MNYAGRHDYRKAGLGLLLRPRITLLAAVMIWTCDMAKVGAEPYEGTGLQLSLSPAGYALSFDGDDVAVADPNDAFLFGEENQLTLEAWVFRAGTGYAGVVNQEAYGLTVAEDGSLELNVWIKGEPERRKLASPPGLVPLDKWSHVAGSWDGTNVRVFTNGNEVATAPLTGDIKSSINRVTVGATTITGGNAWDGAIDEVRVWDLARSEAAIQAASATALQGDEIGLVAYWRLDEGSGQWASSTAVESIRLQLGTEPWPDGNDPGWLESEIPAFSTRRGWAVFDSSTYACIDTATVELRDADLVGNATCIVELSETGGDFEELIVSATHSGSAVFGGSISIQEGFPAILDGYLQVSHGTMITALYLDEDTGEGLPATVVATAVVDCEPPHVFDVFVADRWTEAATVTLRTDETSFATIHYGSQCGDLPNAAYSEGAAGTHEITLTGLQLETRYFFAVEATDLTGNTNLDDNNGECYSFVTTPKEEFYLDFEQGRFAASETTAALDLSLNNQFTVEALVQPKMDLYYPKSLIWFKNDEPTTIGLSGSGEIIVVVVNSQGTIELRTPRGSLPDNSWSHIAVSSDGAALAVWVNGIERGSTHVAGNMKPGPKAITLGGDSGREWNAYRGAMDEVRVWNVARSAKEIHDSMHCPLQGDEPGLVGYWRLNEGFGQWAYDQTSNQIHLRLGSTEEEDGKDPLWVRWLAVVEPTCPTTPDNLECVLQPGVIASVTDPEIFYQWFRNGSRILEPLPVDEDLFFATGPILSHNFTAKNETFFCLVNLIDGLWQSEGLTPPVLIHNSRPTAPVVDIIPENPLPFDGLTAFVSHFSTDADGDDMGYTIRWYLSQDGGQTFDWIPILTWITVPPGYLTEGDVWRVEIVAFETEEPSVESEIGWDQVYVGLNNRPTITISRPGLQNAVACSTVMIQWQAQDADGDAVTVDLYYDTDDIEGGAVPIAMGQPASGWMTWKPPGASQNMVSADLSGDGMVTAEDLFILASEWQTETEGTGYRIFARAWDEKGGIGETFSPGKVIVPEALPANPEGLLRLLRMWTAE